RFAAIDFCRRTHCHIRTLEAVPANGQTHEIELEAPTRDLQITKVYAASVGGRPWPLASTSMGLAMARTQSTEDFAFTQDNQMLLVYPLQPQGILVQVDAALIPSATSTKLDPEVASVHADDIAHGIIARLQSIPKQDFTDLNLAAINQQRFKDRIATVAMKVQ
ncbi:hypothetical protein RZS08_17100, partial [Arthrospira platensis SPKY1]|nr:hypothetical protein [Arthrospira platensis SPKY1]